MLLQFNITLSGPAADVNLELTPFKYGKSKQICFEMDDAAITVKDAYNKLMATFYTDGCGNNKNFAMGVAVNGRNGYDDSEVGALPGISLTYEERDALIRYGLDVMNHSQNHEPREGYDAVRNVAELDALILQKERYKMNIMTVPTNYPGFMTAAAAAGYIGGNSEGTFDGFTPEPLYNPKAKLGNLPVSTYQAIRRAFSDDHSMNGYQWEILEALFTEDFDFFDYGTHGLFTAAAVTNFNSWIDRVVLLSNDQLLFTSLREFLEYNHIRQHITKTQSVSENTLNAQFDFASVPNQNLRWFDLSMKVDSGTITSVTSTDPSWDITYNSDTGLINAQRQRTDWSIVEPEPEIPRFKVSRRYRIAQAVNN